MESFFRCNYGTLGTASLASVQFRRPLPCTKGGIQTHAVETIGIVLTGGASLRGQSDTAPVRPTSSDSILAYLIATDSVHCLAPTPTLGCARLNAIFNLRSYPKAGLANPRYGVSGLRLANTPPHDPTWPVALRTRVCGAKWPHVTGIGVSKLPKIRCSLGSSSLENILRLSRSMYHKPKGAERFQASGPLKSETTHQRMPRFDLQPPPATVDRSSPRTSGFRQQLRLRRACV